MNYKVVSILLVVAVIISAVLFHQKFKDKPTSLDSLKHTLSGLKKLHPANTRLMMEWETTNVEVFLQTRHVLAPIPIIRVRGNLGDTMLVVAHRDDTTTINSFSSRKEYQLRWSNEDENLSYLYLIRK